MKEIALLGRHLQHSFSPGYFSRKFEAEGIEGYTYGIMEIPVIEEFPEALRQRPGLTGLNVTIPYKQEVIPYLAKLDETAAAVGAVNTIRFSEEGLIGFNTDVIGFRRTLEGFIPADFGGKALILGTGGASKAVRFVLEKMGIPFKFISRQPLEDGFTYEEADEEVLEGHHLIINTTPLGMYPKVEGFPELPYHALGSRHYLFDLIYNPSETLFLRKGKRRGAYVKNGYGMLVEQAEAAWEIWNRSYE